MLAFKQIKLVWLQGLFRNWVLLSAVRGGIPEQAVPLG